MDGGILVVVLILILFISKWHNCFRGLEYHLYLFVSIPISIVINTKKYLYIYPLPLISNHWSQRRPFVVLWWTQTKWITVLWQIDAGVWIQYFVKWSWCLWNILRQHCSRRFREESWDTNTVFEQQWATKNLVDNGTNPGTNQRNHISSNERATI